MTEPSERPMTDAATQPDARHGPQAELDRDQLISDLGQAVADRDQGASDHEQDKTDRERAALAQNPTAREAADGPDHVAVRAAQARRDAHQQVLDDGQSARDREQLTFEAQQDLLDTAAAPEPFDVAMRRFQAAESRAAASEQRAEAALRRARLARARAATIARLDGVQE